MKRLKQTRLIFLILLLGMLGANLGLDGAAEGLTTAGVLIIGVIITIIQTKLYRMQMDEEACRARNQFLNTLNIHRHDWMNDLQIIYGYVQLKKVDKLQASVEKIKDRLHQDSKIAKLGNAEFSLFLYDYRNHSCHYDLVVDVDEAWEADQVRDLGLLQALTKNVLEAFASAAKSLLDVENKLMITLVNDPSGIYLEIDYEGGLESGELKQQLETLKQQFDRSIEWPDVDIDDKHAQITISVPTNA